MTTNEIHPYESFLMVYIGDSPVQVALLFFLKMKLFGQGHVGPVQTGGLIGADSIEGHQFSTLDDKFGKILFLISSVERGTPIQ